MYDIIWLVLSVLVICGMAVSLHLTSEKKTRTVVTEPLPPGMTKVNIREVARKGGSTYERILLARHGITGDYQVVNARQYNHRLHISVYYRGRYFIFCFSPESKRWLFLAEVTSDPTGRIGILRNWTFLSEKALQQLPDITVPQGIAILQEAIDCPQFISKPSIQNAVKTYDQVLKNSRQIELIAFTG